MRVGLLLIAMAAAHAAGPASVPVVAELFTSEGCSSCPPADRLLAELDRRQPVAGARVIVLSEHVDYWDQLGWRDPFSLPQFSRRQEQYARVLGGNVYTPELVVDGREPVLGNDAGAVEKAILRAAARAKSPVRIAGARREGQEATIDIAIPPLTKGSGEVWVATADEGDRSSVSRGENAGRTLIHVAVVRSLAKAGSVNKSAGMEKTLRVPLGAASSRVIVFLADGGGTIFGADEASVP
jgi:hypothetical protein